MLQDILPRPAHILKRILCRIFMVTSKPTPNLSAEESTKWQQRWELHFETWASFQLYAEQISNAEISKKNRAQSAKRYLFPSLLSWSLEGRQDGFLSAKQGEVPSCTAGGVGTGTEIICWYLYADWLYGDGHQIRFRNRCLQKGRKYNSR